MAIFVEQLRQSGIRLGRDLNWGKEQVRYGITRETRLQAAEAEAKQLISPLVDVAKYHPGSPEAKKLVLVGANVTSHVVSEVCTPRTKFYLNDYVKSVGDWAKGTAEIETVKQTRGEFLGSDIYIDYLKMGNSQDTPEPTIRMSRPILLVDELLFGAIALDAKGSADLDIAEKRGETDYRMKTFRQSDKDTGSVFKVHGVWPVSDIYSLTEMSLAANKALLFLSYSEMAAGTVSSIALSTGANAIERFYGIESHPTTSNPLFQERINEIIKETLNPTQ